VVVLADGGGGSHFRTVDQTPIQAFATASGPDDDSVVVMAFTGGRLVDGDDMVMGFIIAWKWEEDAPVTHSVK
jgi:hypothetical protein